MPLYDYECQVCGTRFEIVASIIESDFPQYCGNPSCENIRPVKKIILKGHGGVWRPDATWVKDIDAIFRDDTGKPINTVEDLRRFYRENPNVKPMESHPALPSSIGDVSTPPTVEEMAAQRKKDAAKKIADMRRITI